MISGILALINRHTDAVEKKEVKPTTDVCPRCQEHVESFRLHDTRKRSFFAVVGRLVHKVSSLLTRWRCPLCRHKFTLYPPFALPHKRYVKDVVIDVAQSYLTDDTLSYRKAVRVEGMPIFHGGADGSLDDGVVAHSTLHRWIDLARSLEGTVREGLKRIRAKSPSADLFRRPFVIPAWKYRSDKRKMTLRAFFQLLLTDTEHRALFGVSIFPSFATAHASR
jgi:hypothetical protein